MWCCVRRRRPRRATWSSGSLASHGLTRAGGSWWTRSSSGDTGARTPVAGQGALENRLDVAAALARLPEAQRTAIVLVDLQDLSVAEAASVLGVAEGTVKSRCSRGRLALARIFRGEDPEEPE